MPQRPPHMPSPTSPTSPTAPPVTGAARVVAGVFGVAFAGIGCAVVGSLWFSDHMGDPPIIFKLVGSFIAMVFIAMGGTIAFSAIIGGGLLAQQRHQASAAAPASSAQVHATGGYTCPHCGGGIDRGTDVSPMGDIKCSFCGRWFNVHGRTVS